MSKNLVFDVFFFAWRNLSVDVHHHVLATVVKDHANSYIGMTRGTAHTSTRSLMPVNFVPVMYYMLEEV